MFYVYSLQSKIDSRLYIGFTSNLKNRLKLHNAGRVRSTKAYKPWRLVYYEAYREKSDATLREKRLKIHAVKNSLKKQIEKSLKNK